MIAYDIIRRKRDGRSLGEDEIRWFLKEYTQGRIPDYQMSALLMSIFFQGMDSDELATWTDHMLYSGRVLDLSHLPLAKVDKHSTGGVGDKVSLILAPAVAACGVMVPMISGRGLGHTGGTLDKLESIPGFTTTLSPERFTAILQEVGVVIGGQTEEITPADRKLYALRDVTATVDSIPLIASSIMSKKLAEGIDGLVLDVKTGSGAFMRTEERARELATTMVGIGRRMGKVVQAVITDMSQPLGLCVGNALEVRESIEILRGEGPEDLTSIVLELGARVLVIGRGAGDLEEGRERIRQSLADGTALGRFRALVKAQGGDTRVIDDLGRLAIAARVEDVVASRSGYVTAMDTEAIGRAAIMLGAGRRAKEDTIDPSVGFVFHRKLGDQVEAGEALLTAHVGSGGLGEAREVLAGAIRIEDGAPVLPELIVHAIE